MEHILTKKQELIIPKEIELAYNYIDGDLVCSRCKQFIETGWEDATSFGYYAEQSMKLHICGSIKFKYDFNSPLTLKEQYEMAKTKIELEEDINKIAESYGLPDEPISNYPSLSFYPKKKKVTKKKENDLPRLYQ